MFPDPAWRATGRGLGASAPAEPILLSRAQVRAVRPHADAFAEAVLAGARSLAHRGEDGRLAFRSEPVQERYLDLMSELEPAFGDRERTAITARSGRPFAEFLDQVVVAWLRAEPPLGDFGLGDARGSGGFLFEVLRADLVDLGLDLVIEPRPRGYRVLARRSRYRFLAPLLGGAWLGASAGWLLELSGMPGHGAIGFAGGTALGVLLALRSARQIEPSTCSECGTSLEVPSETCPRCHTRLVADVAADAVPEEEEEDALAVGEEGS